MLITEIGVFDTIPGKAIIIDEDDGNPFTLKY
jgi:hypothetical protein